MSVLSLICTDKSRQIDAQVPLDSIKRGAVPVTGSMVLEVRGILLFVQVAEISLQALVHALSTYNHIEMITGFDGIVKEISRIFGEY
jgi:hypothetical protein